MHSLTFLWRTLELVSKLTLADLNLLCLLWNVNACRVRGAGELKPSVWCRQLKAVKMLTEAPDNTSPEVCPCVSALEKSVPFLP